MQGNISDKEVHSCLQEMEAKAVGLGASDTRIITTGMISIEEDIVEMCKPPLCDGYGQSANCPPNVMSPKEARMWISDFCAALLFKIDVSPEKLFSPEGLYVFKNVYIIASELETLAVGRGFVLSKGLGAGSCKEVFCSDIPCDALTNHGKCRYPSLARPSMEALGINVFRLARDVGWEIHTILRNSNPLAIPEAMLAGLLLIGLK